MRACVGQHGDDHVGAGGELVHVVLAVALRAHQRRLRALQAVHLGVRAVLQRLARRTTRFSKELLCRLHRRAVPGYRLEVLTFQRKVMDFHASFTVP